VGAASSSASRLADAAASQEAVPLPDLPPTELDPLDEPDPLKW
jgi:hypothetical protein